MIELNNFKSFIKLFFRWFKAQIFVSLVFLFIGFVIAWLVLTPSCPDGWTVKKEIGVGDVLSFVNAVVIAFLFTTYAQKFIADDRGEKALLMDMCNQVLVCLKDCHNYYQSLKIKYQATTTSPTTSAPTEFHEITYKKQELSKSLFELTQQLNRFRYDFINIEHLRNSYTRYEDIITSDLVYQSQFPKAETKREEYWYYEISNELRTLNLEINRR